MFSASHTIVKLIHPYQASPERVYDAWLDADNIGRWLFATPAGKLLKVELQSRLWGKLVIVERRGKDDIIHECVYRDLSRPRRLAFDFRVPAFSADYTRVVLQIEPAGVVTELTLTHEGVLPEYEDRTREGWEMILANLGRVLDD